MANSMRSIAGKRRALFQGVKSWVCAKSCCCSHSTSVFLFKKTRLDLFDVTCSWQVYVGYLLSCHFDYLSKYFCRVEIEGVFGFGVGFCVCVFYFVFFKDYSFFPFSSFSAIHLFFIKSQNSC